MRMKAGADHQANVMGGGDLADAGVGAMRPADFLGLSANAVDPTGDDLTLAGEIVTGSLVRAQAAYTHTTGTASYTLTRVFTTDHDVVIAKVGVFTARVDGILTFQTLLDEPLPMKSGDQLTAVEVITI